MPVQTLDTGGQQTRNDVVDWNDQIIGAYVYYTASDRLVLSATYTFERFWRADDPNFSFLPKNVDTHYLPLAIGYFGPSGVFGQIRGTFLHQDVDRDDAPDGHDNAFVVDTALGWRLPGRRGIVSLEALNLFDSTFNYQDSNFRTFGTRTTSRVTRYLPERTVLLRATLAF
jgi:hypothetical protein